MYNARSSLDLYIRVVLSHTPMTMEQGEIEKRKGLKCKMGVKYGSARYCPGFVVNSLVHGSYSSFITHKFKI